MEFDFCLSCEKEEQACVICNECIEAVMDFCIKEAEDTYDTAFVAGIEFVVGHVRDLIRGRSEIVGGESRPQ